MDNLAPRLGFVFQLNRPGQVPAPTAANIAAQAFLCADGTWKPTESIVEDYVPVARTINGTALTGDVTLTKSSIGLSLVENISISTWQGNVPIGGNTGEVLTKVSNSDRDVEWTVPSGSSLTNLDGGFASSVYGGIMGIDGGSI